MDRKKILIVDDDADIRLALNARLRASGYETAFAEDGVTALAVARREKPDLILLDIGLPGGDGFVVLERLKKHTCLACTPVIVLSARDAAESQRHALEAGATAFFQKPADNAELLQAIACQLAAPTRAATSV
ncbi:MAG: response regulator [Myxococcales bacterium]|nr:response regulator [Myxococcales bacterium]